jgi:hypothetical protein
VISMLIRAARIDSMDADRTLYTLTGLFLGCFQRGAGQPVRICDRRKLRAGANIGPPRLSRDSTIGTKFKLLAKLTDREDGGKYLYSSYQWPHEVLE